METKFNFNSATCTSIEQSRRLLALGLKKETADMVYRSYGYIIDEFGNKERRFKRPTIRNTEDYEGKYDIPAWSLHRLFQIYTNCVISSSWNMAKFNWDDLIDCIEDSIIKGYFDKEYLCEK